jgi:hypothetical protein
VLRFVCVDNSPSSSTLDDVRLQSGHPGGGENPIAGIHRAGIARQHDRYLRCLFTAGALAVIRHAELRHQARVQHCRHGDRD